MVIGPSNIGDAILASDVIAAVRQRFPDAHLTLVVGSRAQHLFVGDPRVQTLVDADVFSSIIGRVQLAWSLWRYQPQVLVDLRHTLYPLLLKPLGVWRYLRQPPKSVVHMRDRQLWRYRAQVPDHAARAEIRNGHALWFSGKDVAHVDGLWTRWGLGQRPVVVVCPGARSHIKRWTAKGFAEVADRLITELRAEVIFSGEPEEEPIMEEILQLTQQRPHNAVGLLTIRQLGVMMRRAHLVITNDSAALHLASSLQIPTVAIFGPTDERKYGPRAPQARTVRRRLFCAPCEQALCRFNHECMRFVTPDQVFAAAQELLTSHGSRIMGHGSYG